jgi:hypothetical protein
LTRAFFFCNSRQSIKVSFAVASKLQMTRSMHEHELDSEQQLRLLLLVCCCCKTATRSAAARMMAATSCVYGIYLCNMASCLRSWLQHQLRQLGLGSSVRMRQRTFSLLKFRFSLLNTITKSAGSWRAYSNEKSSRTAEMHCSTAGVPVDCLCQRSWVY